jgi:hypothetical protein
MPETKTGHWTRFVVVMKMYFNEDVKKMCYEPIASVAVPNGQDFPDEFEELLMKGDHIVVEINDIISSFFEMKKFIHSISKANGNTDMYDSFSDHVRKMDAKCCMEMIEGNVDLKTN